MNDYERLARCISELDRTTDFTGSAVRPMEWVTLHRNHDGKMFPIGEDEETGETIVLDHDDESLVMAVGMNSGKHHVPTIRWVLEYLKGNLTI